MELHTGDTVQLDLVGTDGEETTHLISVTGETYNDENVYRTIEAREL